MRLPRRTLGARSRFRCSTRTVSSWSPSGDPSNEVVLEGLRRELGTDFQLVVAPHSQLQHVIDEAYARPAPAPAPEREGVLFPDLCRP